MISSAPPSHSTKEKKIWEDSSTTCATFTSGRGLEGISLETEKTKKTPLGNGHSLTAEPSMGWVRERGPLLVCELSQLQSGWFSIKINLHSSGHFYFRFIYSHLKKYKVPIVYIKVLVKDYDYSKILIYMTFFMKQSLGKVCILDLDSFKKNNNLRHPKGACPIRTRAYAKAKF